MSANNYPQFNAAVSELTTRVEGLISRVHETETYHNIERSDLAAQSAGTSADSAQGSATSAAASAATAITEAAQASASAASAATSAATATTKAAEATSSATSVSASLDKANKWAEADENTTVEAGKYSAKHHAAKAAASAATASTKATEAATSATSATGSADTATNKATEAAASAASASTSATTAATKATEASTSASSAGSSAASASTKASEAAASAVTATTEATQAASSATAAGSSAASASAKATEAANSASSASSSAASATASAATATNKATEAASSATAALESKNSAEKWANEPENVAVETGKYSARHHAAKAAASATTSSTKASEAASSATEAAGYRDQAMSAAASVTGSLAELGSVDLSSNAYPVKPVTAGFWKVTVGGVVGGVDYGVGDTLVYSKSLDQFYKIDNTESVTSVNGKTGVVSLTAADVGAVSTTGNAATAAKLQTARTIALSGDVTGSANFDGSGDVSINTQVADDSHTHSLGNLGLGNAATATVQTSPTDNTAGRLMAVGAFGLGSRHVVTDADLAPTGLSILDLGTALNVPGGLTGVGWLETDAELSFTGGKVQRLQASDTGRLFARTVGVTGWLETWHTGNLLKQTSVGDTTAGALMGVGAFGLGAAAFGGTHAHDVVRNISGFFSSYSGAPAPGEFPEEVLLVALQHSNPDYAARLAVGLSGTPYVRSKYAGAWQPAKELFHTGNQLSLGTTQAEAQAALGLVKGTSPGNVLVAGEGLVGRHTVECFAFVDGGITPGVTIYTNIPAIESIMPNLIIRGALNGYTDPFEARLSWYFYLGAVYMPNVLITATGGVSGVRFYLRPENGKIVIRIDFGGSIYISRLAFDALQIHGGYNPDPPALRGWSAVASNVAGPGEVEVARARTYHSRNILGAVAHSDGVPTGAIIERGSNANGEYVRFADGTQICIVGKTVQVITSAVGGGFECGTQGPFNYPAAWLANPSAGFSSDNENVLAGVLGSTLTFYFNCFTFQPRNYTTNVRLLFIGRWY